MHAAADSQDAEADTGARAVPPAVLKRVSKELQRLTPFSYDKCAQGSLVLAF